MDEGLVKIHQLLDFTCWISRLRFRPQEVYGVDRELDMDVMHRKAFQRVVTSATPRVLLVMKSKLQAAAHATMLENQNFKVTVCFSGRDAYMKYLKNNSNDFEAAIVEWDLPDISGRDLVHYVRTDGGNLCFIALLKSNGVTPKAAIRSGADLFLHRPLVLHRNVLRTLLQPGHFQIEGFPQHLMSVTGNFTNMKSVLNDLTMRMDDEVPALAMEVQEDLRMLDEDSINDMHSFLDANRGKNILTSPSKDANEKKLLKGLEAVLETTEKLRAENAALKEENRTLQSTIRGNSGWDAFDSMDGVSVLRAPSDADRLTKKDFVNGILSLQQRVYSLQEEMRAIQNDYDAYAKETQNLYALVVKSTSESSVVRRPTYRQSSISVPVEHLSVTSAGEGRSSRMSNSSNTTVGESERGGSDRELPATTILRLRKPAPKRTQPPFISRIKERLECQMMLAEDAYSAARQTFELRQVQTIPEATLPWPPVLPSDTPLASLYEATIKVIREVMFEVNMHNERVAYLMPKSIEKISNVVEKLHLRMRKHDLPLLFLSSGSNILRQATKQLTESAESPEKKAQGSASVQTSSLEWRLRLAKTRTVAVAILNQAEQTTVLRKYYLKWMSLRFNKKLSKDNPANKVNFLLSALKRTEGALKASESQREANSSLVEEQRAQLAELKDKAHRSDEKVTHQYRSLLQLQSKCERLTEEVEILKGKLAAKETEPKQHSIGRRASSFADDGGHFSSRGSGVYSAGSPDPTITMSTGTQLKRRNSKRRFPLPKSQASRTQSRADSDLHLNTSDILATSDTARTDASGDLTVSQSAGAISGSGSGALDSTTSQPQFPHIGRKNSNTASPPSTKKDPSALRRVTSKNSPMTPRQPAQRRHEVRSRQNELPAITGLSGGGIVTGGGMKPKPPPSPLKRR